MSYLAFTECEGEVLLEVRVVDADGNDVAGPVGGVATARDRLDVVEVIFTLHNIDFPGPGEYFVQATAAGGPLMERRFAVLRGDDDEA